MTNQNLDIYAAECGELIVTKTLEKSNSDKTGGEEKNKKDVTRQLENHVTKSLGVLQENGLYAFFLYQKTESGFGEGISEQCSRLLKNEPILLLKNDTELFAGLRELGSDLSCLLLAKSLIERSLIYARYHAKARRNSYD